MKTKEELNALKEEVEALNKKLAELTEDELKQVVGGQDSGEMGAFIRTSSLFIGMTSVNKKTATH